MKRPEAPLLRDVLTKNATAFKSHKDEIRALATYQPGKNIIHIEDFASNLQSFGLDFYEKKVVYKEAKRRAISFFEFLDGLGLGTYRLGRRKQPTRLIWKVEPMRLLEQVSEIDVEVKEILRSMPPAEKDPGPMLIRPTNTNEGGRPMLTHSDIASDVRAVLLQASKGKGHRPQFVTAYQILDRLPQREQLISDRGMPGKDAGVHNAAAGVVSDAIRVDLKNDVEVAYFDNVGIRFDVAGTPIRAGFPVCGLYRLSDEASAEV